MTFLRTDIDGCFVFSYPKNKDKRGDFSRIICKMDLMRRGDIDFDVKQSSVAFNKKKKTTRGLHYQKEPHGENKIITCISGVIDVFVYDLNDKETIITRRLDSKAEDRESIYIPKHCASGYITIENNSTVLYYMDEYYHPESQGVISLLTEDIDTGSDLKGAIMSDRDSV